jgi:hypothetical protein
MSLQDSWHPVLLNGSVSKLVTFCSNAQAVAPRNQLGELLSSTATCRRLRFPTLFKDFELTQEKWIPALSDGYFMN